MSRLAAEAREHADACGRDIPARRAWLVLAVALAETTTASQARKVLAEPGALPADIRDAAIELLDQITRDPEGRQP